MADLTDIQAAGTVKIVGSDSTGVEQTPVISTANGSLSTTDISNNGGVNAAISVTTSAIEAKVGGSALANRKNLTIHNNGTGTIYWGYSSGVTTTNGTPVFKDQFVSWDVGASTSVFLIAISGTQNVRVTENA